MTPEELGKRAVACKHWRWMPGMLSGTARIVDTANMPTPWVYDSEWDDCGGLRRAAVPDLSDPATLGCLLALVEEAWRCPVDFSFDGAHWTDLMTAEQVWVRDGDHPFEHKTRAEALVVALEAAP